MGKQVSVMPLPGSEINFLLIAPLGLSQIALGGWLLRNLDSPELEIVPKQYSF